MFCTPILEKKFLISFVFLVSVFCSVLFLIFLGGVGPNQHKIPSSDYINLYEPLAENILEGKGPFLDGKLPLNVGLAYPIILSGVFALSDVTGMDRLDLIVILNIFLTALSSLFLFLLAAEMFGKKIGLISSLLWILYPFNLWFIKNPNSEVPFIFLLFLGLFLYVLCLKKKKWEFALLSGLILGLASFVRIIGLFLPVFLAILVLFLLKGESSRKKALIAVILLMGNIVALLPWAVIAFSETGGFLNISNLGSNGLVFGITYLAAQGEGGDRITLSKGVEDLIEKVRVADLNGPIKIAQFFSKEIIANPLPVVSLFGLKLARSWYATSQQWWEGRILMVQAFYFLTILGGLFYGLKFHKDKMREMIFILAVMFYFWFMAFINVSIMRYTVPAMALLFVFSAILINGLVKKIKF